MTLIQILFTEIWHVCGSKLWLFVNFLVFCCERNSLRSANATAKRGSEVVCDVRERLDSGWWFREAVLDATLL
jgi:hypothetical protein